MPSQENRKCYLFLCAFLIKNSESYVRVVVEINRHHLFQRRTVVVVRRQRISVVVAVVDQPLRWPPHLARLCDTYVVICRPGGGARCGHMFSISPPDVVSGKPEEDVGEPRDRDFIAHFNMAINHVERRTQSHAGLTDSGWMARYTFTSTSVSVSSLCLPVLRHHQTDKHPSNRAAEGCKWRSLWTYCTFSWVSAADLSDDNANRLAFSIYSWRHTSLRSSESQQQTQCSI